MFRGQFKPDDPNEGWVLYLFLATAGGGVVMALLGILHIAGVL